jgi:hypothetical protein
MQTEDIWLTRLFNDNLAGLGNGTLGLFHLHAENPAHPWQNYITMQILVALLIMIVFSLLRTRLSADKPGLYC